MGIASLLCGPFAGISTVVLGVMGLNKYEKNPIFKGVVHAGIEIVVGNGTTLVSLAIILLMIVVAISAN